jgi:hypothetical protein
LTGDKEIVKLYESEKEYMTDFHSINIEKEPLKSGAFIARQEKPSGLF